MKRRLGKKSSKRRLLYLRNGVLPFSTPKGAKEGNCADKECPFNGNVSVRGKVSKGRVLETKMRRTTTIRRKHLHYIKKAFPKQDAVVIGTKRLLGKKSVQRRLLFWRNVGLSCSTPKEAKEGNCLDKKCPPSPAAPASTARS